jgi:hypothetical protein
MQNDTVGRHDLQRGLATGFGDTASVGIGGLTLDGGIGYLVRKHGLTIDDRLLRSSPRMGSSGTRTLSATRTCSG